jgi:hypothetical protein
MSEGRRYYGDEPDPRWEVEPEPPDETDAQGHRRLALGGVVLAFVALVLLAGAVRSVVP